MHEFKQLLRGAAGTLGISLMEDMCERFFRYYRLLIEWNEKFNLTSLVEPRDVAIKHFIDSLTCLLVHNPAGGPGSLILAPVRVFPVCR